MKRENPRTYRLSGEALEALGRIEGRTGETHAQIIERLVLAEDRTAREEDLRARVEALEGMVRQLQAERESERAYQREQLERT